VAVLIAPETPFGKETQKAVSHFHLHFYAGKLLDTRVRDTIFVISLSKEMRKVLLDITCLLNANTLDSRFLANCMYAISWALYRVMANIQPIEIIDSRVAAVQDFIGRNYHSPLHTRDLARLAGMNQNAFIRLFKAHIRATPQQFIAARRVEAACDLLHDPDLSMDTIAEQCGFCDRNYFTTVFTRLKGIAPGAYRRIKDQHN
jgi:AraC-like DNA-binding protein